MTLFVTPTVAQFVMGWMLWLQPRAPWLDTYYETAQAIESACDADVSCAALLTSVAWHESRFNPRAVGDGGRSIGLFQTNKHRLGAAHRWATPQDMADIAKREIEESKAACGDLTQYASGVCGVGKRESSSRVRLSRFLLRAQY